MNAGSPSPFPAHLSPRQAGLQAAAMLTVFYGYLYGNAYLQGGTEARVSSLVPSVFLTGSTMLLVVLLFSARDKAWKTSLGLEREAWVNTALFGAVAVVASYAANIVTVGAYLAVAGNVKQMLASKAQWTSKMGELPLVWVLPIALFVGLWEEIVFRGFVLGRLRAAFAGLRNEKLFNPGDVLAVVTQAVLFGLGHGYQGALGFVQTGMVGLAFGAMALWRKSLWPVVIAHLTIDAFGLLMLRVLKPKLEEVMTKLTAG